MRVITEADIIEARERVAAAETNHEQQDWNDALLAAPDLTPDMVREWFNTSDSEGITINVHWCACEGLPGKPAEVVCSVCGLPPFWKLEQMGLEDII